MRTKFTAISLFIILLIIIGAITALSIVKRQQSGKAQEGKATVSGLVKQAKAKGIREVVLPIPEVDYGGSDTDTDKALLNYKAIVAEPIEQKSYYNGSSSVSTWYKFRVVEVLSNNNPPPCSECSGGEPPAEMLPLNSDEFLLAKYGGTVLIDEVRVITPDDAQYPGFKKNKRYLLYASINGSGVARTVAGPAGIFIIEQDGSLKPINENPHPLKEDIKNKFANSIDKLKRRLKS
jgi:hypothetical protein